MKLKRRFDWRKVLIVGYFVVLAAYLWIGFRPAEAANNYDIAAELSIPSIGLVSDVTELSVNDGKLDTPDTIVGSYTRAQNKTLLIGHSSTVFQNLINVKIGDEIIYGGESYIVTVERLTVKADVNMSEILAPAEEDTIIIMTCDGMMLGGGDATHRFMVTAVRN